MFSVGLLYSAHDFLRLNLDTGLTPDEFKKYFKLYKYSTSEKILLVCFKCGWAKVTQDGNIELSERGILITNYDYKPALLLQLEDLILNFNPPWASILPKGRTEAKNFLPPEALQCFKECGLFDELTDELIKFWDKLTLAYRNYTQQRMTEIGRAGEKLSFDFEQHRTESRPLWQSIESNLAGYDLLSVVNKYNPQKLKIEVKATTSNIAYAKIHISKNEWNTAESSINYLFHLWVVNENPKLYPVTVETIGKHIPKDNGLGDWESVEIPFKVLVSS